MDEKKRREEENRRRVLGHRNIVIDAVEPDIQDDAQLCPVLSCSIPVFQRGERKQRVASIKPDGSHLFSVDGAEHATDDSLWSTSASLGSSRWFSGGRSSGNRWRRDVFERLHHACGVVIPRGTVFVDHAEECIACSFQWYH
jgi:hypothetical protein